MSYRRGDIGEVRRLPLHSQICEPAAATMAVSNSPCVTIYLILDWFHICMNWMRVSSHSICMTWECDQLSMKLVHTGPGRPGSAFQKGPVHVWSSSGANSGKSSDLQTTETHSTPCWEPRPYIWEPGLKMCGMQQKVQMPGGSSVRSAYKLGRGTAGNYNRG